MPTQIKMQNFAEYKNNVNMINKQIYSNTPSCHGYMFLAVCTVEIL